MLRISIPTNFLDAAMFAVSKAKTRYYLCGVFIDPRGYIVSTNGRVLFAARVPDARQIEGQGIIVPSEAIAQVRKAAGRKAPPGVEVRRDDQGLWWLEQGAARVNFTPVDGTYPDWVRVVPRVPETIVAAHFDPLYFSAIGNMAKAIGGKKDSATSFTLHQNGENPALVTFPDYSDPKNVVAVRADCMAIITPRRERVNALAPTDFVEKFLDHSPLVKDEPDAA